MPTVSVSVSEDLKKKIGEFEDVNWSAVARKAFEERVHEIELLRRIAHKSTLTEKDAQELGSKINKSMAKKFRGVVQCC
ncbi:MAG: hypothetical protein HY832_03995 [Candidatus Aenigmarchaeota archaeon]|nr:hypothetical protein [Candidatus Aenigmarchaeota archaeon]